MDKVFVGIPTHNNQVTIGTARCLQMTGLDGAMVKMQGRSLLCANFNDLWCQALNSGADYFLLLHSDIEVVTDKWVARMLEIMREQKVDVLSVASPIKNSDDYSCGMSDCNCYKRYRFSKTDLAKLPATFKTKDVREVWEDPALVMIFNTGCLLIRCKKVDPVLGAFQMSDKIELKDGKYTCDSVPEDWFFSVVCHKLGISYACTREIELLHYGVSGWSNQI